jgi:hypothetical protein
MGNACVSTPQGWTFVTFTPSSQPACPSGYGTPTDFVAAPTPAGDMCSCTCGAFQANPCTQGMLTFRFGQTQCLGGANPTVTSDGKCDTMPKVGLDIGNKMYMDCQGTPLSVTTVACAATANLPALTPGAAGRTCTPSGAASGTCPNGSTCVPPVAADAQCIQHDGDMVCPTASFTHRYVVFAPADVMDQRKCDQCTCTSDATMCSNAMLTTYHTADCSSGGITAVIDSGCHPLPGGSNNQNDDHFVYSAMPDKTSCSPMNATVMVTGTVATNPRTICCP